MDDKLIMAHTIESTSPESAKIGMPGSSSRASRLASGLLKYEALIYVGCVVAAMVPLLLVDRFPSQDGAVHLYIALLLQELLGNTSEEVLQHFMLSEHLEPNYLVYPYLYILVQLFPFLVAEKVFIAVAWIAFATAARYAVTFRSPDDAPLAYLFLPFGFGFYLHLGFYNFFLGTILYIAITGFLLRRSEDSGVGMVVAVAFFSLITVVTHLFAWGALLLTLAGIRTGVAFAHIAGKARTPASAIRALVVDGLKLAMAALPSSIIAIAFLLRHTGDGFGEESADGVLRLAFNVFAISPVHGVSAEMVATALPYVFLVWGLLAFAILRAGESARKSVIGADVWLPLALLMAVYFGPHLGLKDFSAQERLLPFTFTLVFLTIAFFGVSRRMKAATVAVVTATILVGTVQRGLFYADADDLLDAYVKQFSEVNSKATVFAPQWTTRRDIVDGKSLGLRINVMQHASTVLAMKRDAVDLSVGLLSPSIYGYFPVHYKPESDFYEVILQGDNDLGCDRVIDVQYFIFWPKEPNSASVSGSDNGLLNVLDRVRKSHARVPPAGDGPAIFWNRDAEPCEAAGKQGLDETSTVEAVSLAGPGFTTEKDRLQ
jgi:hypothetical protein